VGAITAVPEE